MNSHLKTTPGQAGYQVVAELPFDSVPRATKNFFISATARTRIEEKKKKAEKGSVEDKKETNAEKTS